MKSYFNKLKEYLEKVAGVCNALSPESKADVTAYGWGSLVFELAGVQVVTLKFDFSNKFIFYNQAATMSYWNGLDSTAKLEQLEQLILKNIGAEFFSQVFLTRS